MKRKNEFYEVAEALSEYARSLKEEEYTIEHCIFYDVIAPDKETGERLTRRYREGDFTPQLLHEVDSGKWICRCPMNMILDSDDLIWIYEAIERTAKEFGCEMDGWTFEREIA